MPANVEIKAKVNDPVSLHLKAKQLSDQDKVVIQQSDTFFNAPNCRLKLRCLQNQPSELISYDRPDATGPKVSNYHITRVQDPQNLITTLEKALGTKGQVNKERTLYLVGQTRIHVDKVEGLGHFMELEVVLEDNQTAEEGHKVAKNLMKDLGIQDSDLVEGAYMDMILRKKAAHDGQQDENYHSGSVQS